MKVKFKEWDCIVQPTNYNNGRKAILLEEFKTEEPIAVSTVNLPDRELGENEVFIKDYSENEGMETALINAGIIEPLPIQTVISGHASINRYKLTKEALKLW